MTPLVLLGVSTRALAESAARTVPGVVAVDFFGDRDQERVAASYALARDLGLPRTPAGLGAAALRLGAEAVVYGANLENHPEVVEDLARRVQVLGNGAAVLGEVRDWRTLRGFCRAAGVAHAETLMAGEEELALGRGRWLVKRVRSGGGHGVRPWTGERLNDAHVLQAFVAGRPASIAFVADGRDARVFAFCEQLVGRRFLGASGFTWCGNVLPFPAAPEDGRVLRRQLHVMATALASRFGLRGVNGADVVVGRDPDGRPRAVLVEVNPRYSASMELAEIADGCNVFGLHLDACAGRLPEAATTRPADAGFLAKGVVYARRPYTAPDTDGWYGLGRRDVPHEGQRIAAGHPVCTVLARGAHRETCLGRLARRAAGVYGEPLEERGERRERTSHLDHRSHAQAGGRHAQRQDVR